MVLPGMARPMTAFPRSLLPSPAPSGTAPASSVLRDVTAQVRATTIRKVCAQLIKDRQPKELPHSEMSRVERGLQVMDAVRHPRWNAQSSLNCPDMALSRPSRATTGPMMRNTKPVSEASIQIVNPQHETAEGLVRDPDRLTEPVAIVADLKVGRHDLLKMRMPDYAYPARESPVHNERCTPGSGTGAGETGGGNPDSGASPPRSLRDKLDRSAMEAGL